jgi:hypothetical protein
MSSFSFYYYKAFSLRRKLLYKKTPDMSGVIVLERETGLEPATLSLGS